MLGAVLGAVVGTRVGPVVCTGTLGELLTPGPHAARPSAATAAKTRKNFFKTWSSNRVVRLLCNRRREWLAVQTAHAEHCSGTTPLLLSELSALGGCRRQAAPHLPRIGPVAKLLMRPCGTRARLAIPMWPALPLPTARAMRCRPGVPIRTGRPMARLTRPGPPTGMQSVAHRSRPARRTACRRRVRPHKRPQP